MNLSSSELLIYQLITDPETNIKLNDFYDDSIISSICNKYPKYYDVLTGITVKNIVRVAATLIKKQDLPTNEILYLVTYICSNYDPSLMNDSDFVLAYSILRRKIIADLSALDSKIKKAKNQEMMEKDRKLIDRNEQIAKEVASNEEIINGSIKKLNDCLKFRIEFKSDKNLNKKYKLQKKQQKLQGNYVDEPSEKKVVFNELNKLSNMIDNKNNKDDEILVEIRRISEKYNLHKSCYHNEIKSIIKKLNERKETDNTIYNEIQDNINDLEKEYNSYVYLTDEEIAELKNRRKILFYVSDLLKNLDDIPELTNEEYKKKINEKIFSKKRSNVNDSERIMRINENKNILNSEEVLENKVLENQTIQKKALQTTQIDDLKHQEVINDIELMLYEYNSTEKPMQLFSFKNVEYYSEDMKNIQYHKRHYLINHAYSVEKIDGNTIVRIHVINEYPYTSKNVKNFMDDFFQKSILKVYNPLTDRYELKSDLEAAERKEVERKKEWYEKKGIEYEESQFEKEKREQYENITNIQRLITNTSSFKKGKIYPTIAYTFTFDSNNILQEKLFKIEAIDGILYSDTTEKGILYDNQPKELDILNEIYQKYNSNDNYKSIEEFFESNLKKQLINYILINKLPVIYYGKYNKSEEYVDEKQDKGKKLLDSNIAEFTSSMSDCDESVLNKAYFAWYQNYKNKHFSLDYRADFNYNLSDLGAINPEKFIGYNFQKVINKCVFSKSKPGMPVYDELVNSQKRYIDKFNKACCYVSLNSFIESLSEIDNNEIKRGSK